MATGKRKCTWLRRPKLSAFFLPFPGLCSSLAPLPSWVYLLTGPAWVRAARRGIWQGGTDIESPAEYKKRLRRKEERVELVVEPEYLEPEVEKVGLLRRIIARFRSKWNRDNTSV